MKTRVQDLRDDLLAEAILRTLMTQDREKVDTLSWNLRILQPSAITLREAITELRRRNEERWV